jgi:protocatechuate 3,4-dioxygenase beta subunit
MDEIASTAAARRAVRAAGDARIIGNRFPVRGSKTEMPNARRPPLAKPSPLRRRFVLAGAAFVALAGNATAQRALEPTPSQTEGPFYPRSLPSDRDNDLTRIAGHNERARGTPLYLTGRVLNRDGRPLTAAQIELWQCDATGHYHHVGERGPLDDHFQGYGVVSTDSGGRYAFTTIRPVAYAGRPPHLHFKIRHPSAATLTTQLYVAGDATDGDVVLRMSPSGTRERLTVALAPAANHDPGALAGSFDFVVATR